MLAVIAVVVFAIGVALAAGVVKFGSGSSPAPSSAIAGRVSILPGASAGLRGTNCPTAEPPAATADQAPTVTIETAKGKIEIKIDPTLGPRAAGNFIALAACGFYDGVVFHRVATDFVIQGGDPSGTGRGGPGYEFADDPVTVPYKRGVVAMANSGPNTNGSQFFIVLKDNGLDPKYSVFGHVTAGMETADAITVAANGVELPADPVVMTKVTVGPPLAAAPSAGSSAAPPASPAPS